MRLSLRLALACLATAPLSNRARGAPVLPSELTNAASHLPHLTSASPPAGSGPEALLSSGHPSSSAGLQAEREAFIERLEAGRAAERNRERLLAPRRVIRRKIKNGTRSEPLEALRFGPKPKDDLPPPEERTEEQQRIAKNREKSRAHYRLNAEAKRLKARERSKAKRQSQRERAKELGVPMKSWAPGKPKKLQGGGATSSDRGGTSEANGPSSSQQPGSLTVVHEGVVGQEAPVKGVIPATSPPRGLQRVVFGESLPDLNL